jgi:hypothetical protein
MRIDWQIENRVNPNIEKFFQSINFIKLVRLDMFFGDMYFQALYLSLSQSNYVAAVGSYKTTTSSQNSVDNLPNALQQLPHSTVSGAVNKAFRKKWELEAEYCYKRVCKTWTPSTKNGVLKRGNEDKKKMDRDPAQHEKRALKAERVWAGACGWTHGSSAPAAA